MKSLDLQKIKLTFIKTNNSQLAGLSCLASVVKFYEGNARINELLKNSGALASNISLLGLCKAAQAEGFEANGYKGSIDFLMEQEKPVILHLEKDSGNEDFVVVYGWQNNKFVIGDPQWGIVEYREEELDAVWKSKALMLLEPSVSFQSVKDKKQIKKEWVIKLFKKQKKNLILNGIVGGLLAIIFVCIFFIILNTVEQLVIIKGIQQLGIDTLLLFFLILAVIAIILLKNRIVAHGAKSIIYELNNYLAKSVFSPSPDRGKQTSAIINSLSNTVQQFGDAVVNLASDATFYGILSITALVYISIHLVWLGFFVFVSSVILIMIIWLFRKKIGHVTIMGYQAEMQKGDTLTNVFEYNKYAQLTNSEKTFSSATENAMNFSVNTRKKLLKEKDKITIWFVIISVIVILVVVFMYLLTSSYNNQFAGFHLLCWLLIFLLGLNRFVNMLMDYFQLKVSFSFLYDFLGKELTKSEEYLNEPSKMLIHPITSFCVHDLSFSFPGKLPVFQNISFTAKKGEITAIYGEAGSGKSTMVSVLNRILSLEVGDILVDGKSWQSFNNLQWRKYSSTVLQPVQLFNSSVLENIGLGDKSMDHEKIITFCKQTGFDKFFGKLDDGYATNCNIISAGQKQIVSLASAICRNPEILLLDEPFAFMDDEMIEFCWQLLQQLKSEMLIMIFTGNRECAKMADKSLFL